MFICITRKVYEYKWYYTFPYYTTWNFPVLYVELTIFVSVLRWCLGKVFCNFILWKFLSSLLFMSPWSSVLLFWKLSSGYRKIAIGWWSPTLFLLLLPILKGKTLCFLCLFRNRIRMESCLTGWEVYTRKVWQIIEFHTHISNYNYQ